jgi:hypothetical protein
LRFGAAVVPDASVSTHALPQQVSATPLQTAPAVPVGKPQRPVAPQLSSLVAGFSQPFVMPHQSSPPGQAQNPPEQPTGEQSKPPEHMSVSEPVEPQFVALVSGSTQPPPAAHSPSGHWQTPPAPQMKSGFIEPQLSPLSEHMPVTAPVAPQWVMSVRPFTQPTPEMKHWPDGHWQSPPAQMRPPVQVSPPAPAHPPQWVVLVSGSTHMPAQVSVALTGQSQSPATPPPPQDSPPATLHVSPPEHELGAPVAPHCVGLVNGFWQTVPSWHWPSGHRQVPEMQLRPRLQAIPPEHIPDDDAPHCVGLFSGLWQLVPSKHCPLGQLHTPPVQTRPPVQTLLLQLPAAPQWSASVRGSMHSPMHSVGVADGHTQVPELQVWSDRHPDAGQEPTAEQKFRSVRVERQAPEHDV